MDYKTFENELLTNFIEKNKKYYKDIKINLSYPKNLFKKDITKTKTKGKQKYYKTFFYTYNQKLIYEYLQYFLNEANKIKQKLAKDNNISFDNENIVELYIQDYTLRLNKLLYSLIYYFISTTEKELETKNYKKKNYNEYLLNMLIDFSNLQHIKWEELENFLFSLTSRSSSNYIAEFWEVYAMLTVSLFSLRNAVIISLNYDYFIKYLLFPNNKLDNFILNIDIIDNQDYINNLLLKTIINSFYIITADLNTTVGLSKLNYKLSIKQGLNAKLSAFFHYIKTNYANYIQFLTLSFLELPKELYNLVSYILVYKSILRKDGKLFIHDTLNYTYKYLIKRSLNAKISSLILNYYRYMEYTEDTIKEINFSSFIKDDVSNIIDSLPRKIEELTVDFHQNDLLKDDSVIEIFQLINNLYENITTLKNILNYTEKDIEDKKSKIVNIIRENKVEILILLENINNILSLLKKIGIYFDEEILQNYVIKHYIIKINNNLIDDEIIKNLYYFVEDMLIILKHKLDNLLLEQLPVVLDTFDNVNWNIDDLYEQIYLFSKYLNNGK